MPDSPSFVTLEEILSDLKGSGIDSLLAQSAVPVCCVTVVSTLQTMFLKSLVMTIKVGEAICEERGQPIPFQLRDRQLEQMLHAVSVQFTRELLDADLPNSPIAEIVAAGKLSRNPPRR